MIPTDQLHTMLGLLLFGFLMLGIGFSFRDKGWGVGLMLFGSAVLLVTIGTRILKAVSLS
ncbi:hypothetical protein SAMN05216198_2868 [Halopseudomonas litoralis]|uniref:Uncharacterized protein n=1 Tax=Halopseudomonas litoralis TaxID=797277 RepID=A0A1H1VBK3_9GAMM|nr:hypothetical protein [Halopseudomonas litoralis]SDS81990.1 hypothetical protein SAMN05216198_2868 [Halopseudomonas litoralis]